MTDQPLFKKIQFLRQFLRQNPTLGDLTNEKFLTIDGNYVGHAFCFERGEANWNFDSKVADVKVAGRTNQILVESIFTEFEAASISAFGGEEVAKAA